MIRSSCLCGGIVWEAEGSLCQLSHCHCSMCRKAHGVGYATYSAATADDFRFAKGEELRARFESSPGNHHCFCSRCGSSVSGDPAGDRIFLPVGNVDGDPGGRPEMHVFVASKAPWHTITDPLPQHDADPPGWPVSDIPDRAPDPRRLPGSVRGSCLCGGAAFEVVGEPQGIVQCHCSRCRKARSAAHGANLFYRNPTLEWLRGADLRKRFKVQGAARFAQTFCGTCGSPLPRDVEPGSTLLVPAGCLDDDPGVRARVHIFVGSKAPWVEISDDLPQLEEGPPPQP